MARPTLTQQGNEAERKRRSEDAASFRPGVVRSYGVSRLSRGRSEYVVQRFSKANPDLLPLSAQEREFVSTAEQRENRNSTNVGLTRKVIEKARAANAPRRTPSAQGTRWAP